MLGLPCELVCFLLVYTMVYTAERGERHAGNGTDKRCGERRRKKKDVRGRTRLGRACQGWQKEKRQQIRADTYTDTGVLASGRYTQAITQTVGIVARGKPDTRPVRFSFSPSPPFYHRRSLFLFLPSTLPSLFPPICLFLLSLTLSLSLTTVVRKRTRRRKIKKKTRHVYRHRSHPHQCKPYAYRVYLRGIVRCVLKVSCKRTFFQIHRLKGTVFNERVNEYF